jgi:hypothetical protein
MHLTLGHILYALAAATALYALSQFALATRYTGAGHGAGTPGYARVRDAKRYTVWGGALALLFLLFATLTPLRAVALW